METRHHGFFNTLYRKIQYLDLKLIQHVQDHRTGFKTIFFKFISMMGDGILWALLGLGIWYFTNQSDTWLGICLLSFGLELAFYKLIKQSTSRRRPFQRYESVENLVDPPDLYSFPSGHTAAATVAALNFTHAIPETMGIWFILVPLIGFSRLYLGVHYLSDILIGFLIGLTSYGLAYWFFNL